MSTPKVFISYSWDDEEHKQWVHHLATRLRADGIETILDQWHAIAGDQLPAFMARAVRDSDFVLLICTPQYKQKAERNAGGVKYEGDIIQAEVLLRGNHRKFIPVLRRGSWSDSAPVELQGKVRLDLSDGAGYEKNYEALLRTLHGEIEQPPIIGPKPDFSKHFTGTVRVTTLAADMSLFRGGIALSADGRRAVSISASNKIIGPGLMKLWDLDKGQELHRMYVDDSFGDPRLHSTRYCVALASDGRQLLSGSNRLRIWDGNIGIERHTWWPDGVGHVEALEITADGRRAVGLLGKELQVFDLENLELTKAIKSFKMQCAWFESFDDLALTSDGKVAVCASSKGTIRVCDLENGRETRTLIGHGATVKSVTMIPSGEIVVSGSADKTLKVWSLPTGSELCTLRGHSESINAVAVTADGKYALSGSDDKTVKVWDLKAGTELRTLGEHLKSVCCVAMTPGDGRVVISGSTDGLLKVWHLS